MNKVEPTLKVQGRIGFRNTQRVPPLAAEAFSLDRLRTASRGAAPGSRSFLRIGEGAKRCVECEVERLLSGTTHHIEDLHTLECCGVDTQSCGLQENISLSRGKLRAEIQARRAQDCASLCITMEVKACHLLVFFGGSRGAYGDGFKYCTPRHAWKVTFVEASGKEGQKQRDALLLASLVTHG